MDIGQLKIPEIYYDFFVRLLPGVYFILVTNFMVYDLNLTKDLAGLLCWVFISYFAGLLMNPVSALILMVIEDIPKLKKIEDANEKLIHKIISRYDDNANGTHHAQDPTIETTKSNDCFVSSCNLTSSTFHPRLFDKMNAEVLCFIQLACFSSALSVVVLINNGFVLWKTLVAILVVTYCMGSAVSYSIRRKNRIKKYLESTLDTKWE